MAFIDDEGGNGRYVKIVDGSLCEKSKTQLTEKYELFQTKNPQTDEPVEYYIRRYKKISGLIDSLERVELEGSKIFGWNLHMHDEDGNFSIFFKDDARVTDRLLKVFENIDLNEEVTISVWKDGDGKPAITFEQNGENVPQKWVGGQEGNLPQPKKTKGKWDYSAVGEFLYNNAMENIIPQFAEKAEAASAASAGTATAGAENNDDIPF